jgi:3-deoxy-D-manno-octulosonic-acid transferase
MDHLPQLDLFEPSGGSAPHEGQYKNNSNAFRNASGRDAHEGTDIDRGERPGNIAAMPSTSLGYRAAARLGAVLAPAVAAFSPRWSRAITARHHAGNRLLEWARSKRDPSRPLAWFHAASVGEGLQAEAVLRQFRRLCPDSQTVYTHFSPSAAGLAARIPVDAADYLPYDLPANVDRLLSALRSDLLIFAKLDLWPELATRAAAAGTQVAMVAATVSRGSSRLRWPARVLLRPGYRSVTAAAAISPEDGARLAHLGVSPEHIRILGDPRFDSVAAKVQATSPTDPLLRFGQGAPTMVAGSTWPEDEAVLLRAFVGVRGAHPDARLILVPHEPGEEHLRSIERTAATMGLPLPVRLSATKAAAPLLLVDGVGILASLYGAGSMAYVGGGFGRAGLHSVLEPAAWGIPVAFGPHWYNSRDAALLLADKGGIAMPSRASNPVGALERQWCEWIVDDAGRRAQGQRARSVVQRGLGAAERSAAMLVELISSRPLRRSPNGARSSRP